MVHVDKIFSAPPPKPTYHILKVDVIRQLFSDYQHAPLIQRCVISFESGWNFQIYSLVSLLVDLLAHAPLSQIYSWVSLFIHECLFTPKKSKNLLTSWVDFCSKGANLTLDFFFILERAQAWAPGPGPQPLAGANWGHKVHRQGLGGTIWALGPRSFIKTLGPFGPLGPYPPVRIPEKKRRELTLFHIHEFSVRWGNLKLGHYVSKLNRIKRSTPCNFDLGRFFLKWASKKNHCSTRRGGIFFSGFCLT